MQPIQDIGRKCFGIYFGTVLQHLTHGQLKVYVQGIYPEEWKTQPDLLPICQQVVSQFAGSHEGNGLFSYPNIGATVVCMFANGDQNMPLMVGSLLGGQNAFGQYEIVRTNDELTSTRHLVTAGKSHVEMFEDGKISAIVFQPIRTEATAKYNGTPDSPISVDAVESRPICEKVDSNEISNINCQIVLDNYVSNGTLSNSTHYFDPINFTENLILSTEQKNITTKKTGQISTDSYNVVDNSGIREFGQISSLKSITLSNINDIANSENANEVIALTADVETSFMHDINGQHAIESLCSITDAYNYSFYNNNTKETILSTHNIKEDGDSHIGHFVGTSFDIHGKQSGKISEVYVNSQTYDNRALNLNHSAESRIVSTGKSRLEIDVLSSSRLTETDSKIGLQFHTNKHKTDAMVHLDTEKGITIDADFDDNDIKSANGTLIIEKHSNYSKMHMMTSKDPDIKMQSKKKMTKIINGAPQKYDVECSFDQSPTNGKIELLIKDNQTKDSCTLTMDSSGNIKINATKTLMIDAPDITFKGVSFKQTFTTLSQIAQTMLIKGSNGDCKIKNVSLLNHKHMETQAGDVVSPQPTKIATQSN